MRPKPATIIAALLATLAFAAPTQASEDPASTIVNKAGEAGYYTCTTYGGSEESCDALPAGKHPSATAIAAYAASWTHRALGLQYELANDVPFANAPWIGTHNSFNSMAYGYTPSRSDSNLTRPCTVADG